jgi:hypothetical protein
VLKLERRVSHEGMVSIGGNAYSVPDTARRRVLEVHSLVDEIRILEDGRVIASHVPLEGRGHTRIDPAHRRAVARSGRGGTDSAVIVPRAGDQVARRSLDFYDAVGRALAVQGNA